MDTFGLVDGDAIIAIQDRGPIEHSRHTCLEGEMKRYGTNLVMTICAMAIVLTMSTSSFSESPRCFSMRQPHKSTPEELLRSAAYEGNIREVQRLLAQGTAVDARDKEGWTPLIWAQAGEQPEVVELLLAKGADINAKDHMGCTALHQAALAGRVLVMRVLLARGAAVENISRAGYTPLMDAALYGRTVPVELLLAHGADPNAVNINGRTAVSLAETKGHRHVALLLVVNGADPHLQGKRLRAALAGLNCRTRGPSRMRLAGYMRNPEVLEDLCQECLSRQTNTQITLVAGEAVDMNGRLAAWCRRNGVGQGRDARRFPQDFGDGKVEVRVPRATGGLQKDSSIHLLRQAIETWEQIQAKYPDAHMHMRELLGRGAAVDQLSGKDPLLQKALDIWTTIQREHPELMAHLMSMAGLGR